LTAQTSRPPSLRADLDLEFLIGIDGVEQQIGGSRFCSDFRSI
jgi:hypothetical protein